MTHNQISHNKRPHLTPWLHYVHQSSPSCRRCQESLCSLCISLQSREEVRWKSQLNYAMKYLISIVSSLIRQTVAAASSAMAAFLGDTMSPVLVSVFCCELFSCPGLRARNTCQKHLPVLLQWSPGNQCCCLKLPLLRSLPVISGQRTDGPAWQ